MKMIVCVLSFFFYFTELIPDAQSATPANQFTLPDLDGKTHSLADFRGKIVVLEWFNSGCPFVKKHYDSGNMQLLQRQYTGKGVIWLTINSSAPGKQGNASNAEHKKVLASWNAVPTAFLLDPTGEVGQAYGARTTPHMYVINPSGELVYQGAIDSNNSSDPEDIPSSENYVTGAIDAVLAGKTPAKASTEPYGCSIKYAS